MKVMVTGGGGYLGGAIVRSLVARGDEVISLQRGHYPELVRPGIQAIQGDMTDQATVDKASKDCDAIYHVAGLTGVWGSYQDYYHINVTGTECVLNACRTNGISKLVYTSSPVSYSMVMMKKTWMNQSLSRDLLQPLPTHQIHRRTDGAGRQWR